MLLEGKCGVTLGDVLCMGLLGGCKFCCGFNATFQTATFLFNFVEQLSLLCQQQLFERLFLQIILHGLIPCSVCDVRKL